jgi:hypothetical protein
MFSFLKLIAALAVTIAVSPAILLGFLLYMIWDGIRTGWHFGYKLDQWFK